MENKGLTSKEVLKSREIYGANVLTPREKQSIFSRFLSALGDPIIKVLLAALAINVLFLFKTADWLESLGIALAVLLATIVSVISEAGSESAFEKLQQEADKKTARVIRDGEICEVLASDVVVGDVIHLQAGEGILADGDVIDGNFACDQAALNGESKEAKKGAGLTGAHGAPLRRDDCHRPLHPNDSECNLREGQAPPLRTNDGVDFLDNSKVFSGAVVTNGEGYMRVSAVGDGTFYGKLAGDLNSQIITSPLKERLGEFAKVISRFGYTAAFIVAVAYVFNQVYVLHNYQNWIDIANHALKALTIAVSVIVMAVPEGLPMMITIVLARNMKNMLKDNVLVRKLVGIETAGSLNILFTDKTGTLTNGKLQVAETILADGVKLEELKQAVCANCSAESSKNGIIGGNATDRALLEWAYNRKKNEIEERLPFNSENKFMATLGKNGTIYIKGAPEIILKHCGNSIKHEIIDESMRYIAVAITNGEKLHNGISRYENLKLLGIIGLKDTLRTNIIKTVLDIKRAGVSVVMITGDSKVTATEIAKHAGIISEANDIVLTSSELNRMNDGEIGKILPKLKVVARALPTDKSRLVKIAQGMGLVVGMTGDGVNDAPALSNADVGFAMGSGTEVAKEAADIVVLDDNLASISKAICYGRTIFKNIRKFIVYQLTVSMGAVGILIIGPFIGADNPITVIQMLWINIVMDSLSGLAFAGEMALQKYMKERPKRRDERIMTAKMWGQIAVCGATISAICLGFLKLVPESANSMTAFFALFMFSAIFMSFNARTESKNLLEYMAGNKAFIVIMSFVAVVQMCIIYFGGEVFRTNGLGMAELLLVIGVAFLVVPVDLVRKRLVG